MKRIAFLVLLFAALAAAGQSSGLHIPSEKPIKPRDLPNAWTNPEVFCLLLRFDDSDSAYREEDLDLLDSAYSVAFSKDNPRMYTMSIEAYGKSRDGQLYIGAIINGRTIYSKIEL